MSTENSDGCSNWHLACNQFRLFSVWFVFVCRRWNSQIVAVLFSFLNYSFLTWLLAPKIKIFYIWIENFPFLLFESQWTEQMIKRIQHHRIHWQTNKNHSHCITISILACCLFVSSLSRSHRNLSISYSFTEKLSCMHVYKHAFTHAHTHRSYSECKTGTEAVNRIEYILCVCVLVDEWCACFSIVSWK